MSVRSPMNQPSIAELSKLIGFLYDGHIEEDPYSAFLAETRRIIDSNFASITMREPQGDDGGLLFVSCEALPKTFVDDHDNPYTDRYYTSNLMTNLPWGKVVRRWTNACPTAPLSGPSSTSTAWRLSTSIT